MTESNKLNTFALFSLSFSSMVGSGIFDIPQNIAHKAGLIAVLINWIIVSFGMLSLAWCFSYITRKRPDITNGIYGYSKEFGDYIAFNNAWGYWLNTLLGDASYLIYIFASLSVFFKIFDVSHGDRIFAFAGETALIWIIYFIIIQKLQQAVLINKIISTIKIFAIIAVILILFYGFHVSVFLENLSNHNLELGNIFEQVKSTMLVSAWDFIGIEAACLYAAYAYSAKSINRAMYTSVILVLVMDMLISCLPFGILPTSSIQTLATPSSVELVGAITNHFISDTIRISVVISVMGALFAWQLFAMNIIMIAATDKTMPSFLSKLNKNGVGKNAALFSSIVLQIFIICAYLTESVYITIIQVATSLILIPYLLTTIFCLKTILINKTIKTIDYVALIKGAIAFIYIIWIINSGGITYLAVSSSLYTVGIIIFAITKLEKKQKIFDFNYERHICASIVLIAIVSCFLCFII